MRKLPSRTTLQRQVSLLLTGALGGLAVGAAFGDVLRENKTKEEEPRRAQVQRGGGAAQVERSDENAKGSVRHTALTFGSPGVTSKIFYKQAFVCAYDKVHRHPLWTAEHLTEDALRKRDSGGSDRARSVFKEDEEVDAKFRARLSDYMRSGYDRGHMVPAADAKQSQDALDETFALTNIAPQVGDGFNRDYWAHLEDFCRRLTSSFKDVYVLTIPLYLPKQSADGKWRVTYEIIGGHPNGVAVPTHFAKVIMARGAPASTTSTAAKVVNTLLHQSETLALGAFVLPNAPIADTAPLTSFIVPVEAVERASGLTLFSDVADARPMELCRMVKCDIIVRKFDDRRRSLSSPPAFRSTSTSA